MNFSWRYPVIVQVVTRNGRDMFYGISPDFGIEVFEALDPGNASQEYMFHLKMRRLISERLSVQKAEKKEVPSLQSASKLVYADSRTHESENGAVPEMVSTSDAASLLSVHPDTVRSLFDQGVLKGVLTKGRQRLISKKSIEEEKCRMTNRVEIRKLELRAQKKNSKRRSSRVRKEKEAKEKRFQENMQFF